MANPTKFRWQAPKKNTDGTDIDYDINYELGEDQGNGTIVPLLTIVGSLQSDGFFEAPISAMTWTAGSHTVSLRSVNAGEVSKVSTWSEAVTFLWSDRVPNPPLMFSVA